MTVAKEFVVKRSEWLRGEGGGKSYLLRGDGRMCCLGFHAVACGASSVDILHRIAPGSVDGVTDDYQTWSRFTRLEDIMTANDAVHMDDESRERQLTHLFAAIGIKVVFE